MNFKLTCISEYESYKPPVLRIDPISSALKPTALAGRQGTTHADLIHQLHFHIGLLLESDYHSKSYNDLLKQVQKI